MASTLSTVRPGAAGAPADGNVTPEKKKGGKKKLIIIALVVVLLGGGGGYYMTSKGKGKPAKPQPGAVLTLDSINMNLSDGHYLKLDMALQTTKKAPSTLDGSQAMDLAISEYSGMSMQNLSIPAKREAAKAQLIAAVEKAYPGQIMDIYYTEFVMQ